MKFRSILNLLLLVVTLAGAVGAMTAAFAEPAQSIQTHYEIINRFKTGDTGVIFYSFS